MFATGRHLVKPGKGFLGEDYGERLTFVGDAKNPLWVGKKKDVAGLVDKDFVTTYKHWRRFHYGIPMDWGSLDPVLVDSIIEFEEYHRRHFSEWAAALKYLEAINKALVEGFERLFKMLKAKRRRR